MKFPLPLIVYAGKYFILKDATYRSSLFYKLIWSCPVQTGPKERTFLFVRVMSNRLQLRRATACDVDRHFGRKWSDQFYLRICQIQKSFGRLTQGQGVSILFLFVRARVQCTIFFKRKGGKSNVVPDIFFDPHLSRWRQKGDKKK